MTLLLWCAVLLATVCLLAAWIDRPKENHE